MQIYNDKTSNCRDLFMSVVGHAKWTHCISCSELQLFFYLKVFLVPKCVWLWGRILVCSANSILDHIYLNVSEIGMHQWMWKFQAYDDIIELEEFYV